ncbi:MAG: hypothetical protein HY699_11370 [Deltaproteobacteria bacterium]|nr:hypothetical protein [Deltaproteobacteria bacterium]
MMHRELGVLELIALASFALAGFAGRVHARALDKDGDIKLGVRTYVNARIGTERTDREMVLLDPENPKDRTSWAVTSETFPLSEAGHLRQNRFYLEAELGHDLSRLLKEGFGPLELLNHLPFRIRGLNYHLTFRGEGEGLYNWGPREFSTASWYTTPSNKGADGSVNLADSPVAATDDEGVCHMQPGVSQDGACFRRADVAGSRTRLRKLGTDRERLFQAYIEGSVGDLFVRLGRQVWSWGETDGFRLLDNINPVDNSFGGFLISLDERLVPLDMLRLEYRLGEQGPLSEMAVHAYGAIDNKVGFAPGTPEGSPWTLPNLGAPSATTKGRTVTPSRTLPDIRGGARLCWNMFDATFSLAHYYTYFDTPALQIIVAPDFPLPFIDHSDPELIGYSALALQTAPKVQVSGATVTFPIDSLYTIVRSEIAYFKDEPRFRQSRIDPFVFHGLFKPQNPTTGGRELGDSINFVLGFDINQYIRSLNPYQTFFFSTQFFYKHLRDAVARGEDPLPYTEVFEGEVLPVPQRNAFYRLQPELGALEPSFIRHPTDQFLHTLYIATSFRSGTINPSVTFFYDWTGGFVYAPAIGFQRDPWRFSVEYDILDAGTLKGASGVSLLRDRDNVVFQFEYAI